MIKRITIITVFIFAAVCVITYPGCSSSGMRMPSLVPKKEPAGGGMLGLAMNDFFQKLKKGRENIDNIDTYYLKLPEKKHWQTMQKWQGVFKCAYRAYHDYGMALYNYSAFKDGSPVDRAPFIEKAAEVARVGREALPEMRVAIPRMAELKNRAFNRLDGDHIKGKYSLPTWNPTKPLVEYPIDPLEELRTRKKAGKALYEYFLEGKKSSEEVKVTDTKAIQSIYYRWGDEILYPYKMLLRECRWLLSLVYEHDIPEACSIVMEIENRLPGIEKISEEIWEKIGGRERAEDLHEKLLKKDLFHKREYVLTRHCKREKKELQIPEEEIQEYYSAFGQKRDDLKEQFGYREWPGRDLPAKQGISQKEILQAFNRYFQKEEIPVWDSGYTVRKTQNGLIIHAVMRISEAYVTVIWGETPSATQSYLIDYLTRPFAVKEKHRHKPSDETGDILFYDTYTKWQKKPDGHTDHWRFIRNNILILSRFPLPLEKFKGLTTEIDSTIRNLPDFTQKQNAYNEWFTHITDLSLSVNVNKSIPISIPLVPEENLKPFCLELDTHSYIMEKEGKFTCHGWEEGQGRIAVGLVNKDRGEIVRYEVIDVSVVAENGK